LEGLAKLSQKATRISKTRSTIKEELSSMHPKVITQMKATLTMRAQKTRIIAK